MIRRTMKSPMNTRSLFASVALLTLEFCTAQAQNAPESMRFFVTSTGLGKGGDLGGLAGADAHCQSLAAGVGAGTRTWHAYLSTQATAEAVNAREVKRTSHKPSRMSAYLNYFPQTLHVWETEQFPRVPA